MRHITFRARLPTFNDVRSVRYIERRLEGREIPKSVAR
jgi:hypothetical protein